MDMIDLDFFKRSHMVKLQNALNNKLVRKKIHSESEYWNDLINLCKRLNIEI